MVTATVFYKVYFTRQKVISQIHRTDPNIEITYQIDRT